MTTSTVTASRGIPRVMLRIGPKPCWYSEFRTQNPGRSVVARNLDKGGYPLGQTLPKVTRANTKKEGTIAPSDHWRVTGRNRSDMELLTSFFVLNSVKGFGPVRFRKAWQMGLSPSDIWKNPSSYSFEGKRDRKILKQLEDLSGEAVDTAESRAERQLSFAQRRDIAIVSYSDPRYPENLRLSNNPVPLLFARGETEILDKRKAVAVVGTRSIRPPYDQLHAEFASVACEEDFLIVAGFALGADTIGHKIALDKGGNTVAVMPSGLDRPFPPENKELWEVLLRSPGGLAVSEFPTGWKASSVSLRKRNKLIAALSLGVVISQTARKGGSLNAYRAALEQRKPVATFSFDLRGEDAAGNQMIAASRPDSVTVFPLESSRIRGYRRWLRELSSST